MHNDYTLYKNHMIHAVYQRHVTEVWSLASGGTPEAVVDKLQEGDESFVFQHLLVQPEGQYGLKGYRCDTLGEAKSWIDGQESLTAA